MNQALQAQIHVMQQALVEQSNRINEMRAALRKIAELTTDDDLWEIHRITRAVLAPKQDECIHAWSAPFDGMVKCVKCGAALTPEQDNS